MKNTPKKVYLTNEQMKFLKRIHRESAAEGASYFGYVIPKDHPRNDLTPKQAALFKKEMKLAWALVKKNRLDVVQDDRAIAVFNLL